MTKLPNSNWSFFLKYCIAIEPIINHYDDLVKLQNFIPEKDRTSLKPLFVIATKFQDENGNTFLHHAAEKNDLEKVKWLVITAEACVTQQNKAHQAALDILQANSSSKATFCWLEGYYFCNRIAEILNNATLDKPEAFEDFRNSVFGSLGAKLAINPKYNESSDALKKLISEHKNYEKMALLYINNYMQKIVNLSLVQRQQYIEEHKKTGLEVTLASKVTSVTDSLFKKPTQVAGKAAEIALVRCKVI